VTNGKCLGRTGKDNGRWEIKGWMGRNVWLSGCQVIELSSYLVIEQQMSHPEIGHMVL